MVNVYNCTLCCFRTASLDDMNTHIADSNNGLVLLKCAGEGCNTRFCLESQTLSHFPHCAAMRRWKAKTKYGLQITEKRVRRKCDVSEERNGQHATFATSVALVAPPTLTAAPPSTKSPKKKMTVAKKARASKRKAEEDDDVGDQEELSNEDDNAPPSAKPSKKKATPAKKGVARKRKAVVLDLDNEEEPISEEDDLRIQDKPASGEELDDEHANNTIGARTQRGNKKPRVANTQEASNIAGSFPSRRARRPAGLTYAPSWYARLEAKGHDLRETKRNFKEADTIAWKAGLGPHPSIIQQVFDEWALEEQVGKNSVAGSAQDHATSSASSRLAAPTQGLIHDLTGEDDEGPEEGVQEEVARGPIQPAGNSEVTPDIDDPVDLDNMFGQPALAHSPMRARPSGIYLPPLPAVPLAPRVHYDDFQMPELSEDEDEDDDLPALPDVARAGLRPGMAWDGQTVNPQETLLHPERGRRDRAGWYRPPRDGR
ncbi:uncharacterized protein MYCGRDRAFT_95082 [Zymoseptoria tritici IPO323]|uniref:Uncharacterized protein n=1 Tax=Zymoseptoria tritici (strain CBS 115943 / IPO323) TaxID=336722 RepID=F9XH91_ZYMTI|nr:uncharacterized protein MYCGRDRAFT_95082 [Zymoseptoria tritici IPO323]EGP84967.1 hypothetical protein MYCGRDRAFT_95082 [Zymoseptoria tritici IPO323]